MPYVFTVNSKVSCLHNGTAQLSSTAKLSVSGAKVLLLEGVSGAAISGCTNPTDNQGDKTCMTVASASGTATKLKVGGKPVVNDTFTGSSDGANPPPAPVPLPLTASAGQTKLSAV